MRIYKATLNTMRGFAFAARHSATRQEMIVLVLAVPLGVFIAPGVGWYVAMIGSLLIALAVELLNTAMENVADRVTLEKDVRIGMAKDFGSAAVFCALCMAGLVWAAAVAVRFDLI